MNHRVAILSATVATILVVATAGCLDPAEAPALLRISFGETARHPADRLRIVGGPAGELSLHGSAFQRVDGARWSDTLRLAAAPSWPLEIAVIAASGDTLGFSVATIALESGNLTTVWLVLSANQGGIFGPCAPTLARIPVLVPNAVSDTLYVTSWGPAPPGAQLPVC